MGLTPPPPPFCISIHAPHARSDPLVLASIFAAARFQSTLLMRGATQAQKALRSGHKFQSTLLMRGATRMPPARPRSGRFQSTLLMRGATRQRATAWVRPIFQSTLLMRGATPSSPIVTTFLAFQSTLLMRGATLKNRLPGIELKISIHAPHARSDQSDWRHPYDKRYFNPRSSCEERLFQ